jgi:catechol 2,3-dioxygenase-like lactoylglutathione lyase family enzyme
MKEGKMSQATTGISAVGRVIVPVTDQDKALEFYVGKLGFEKRFDESYGDGERWVEVAPPGAATLLALALPMPQQATGVGTGIALATSDIDALHAELVERGVDCGDVTRMTPPVPPMFFFRDQDGNTLFVTEE